jgi:chemotaxis protein CheD
VTVALETKRTGLPGRNLVTVDISDMRVSNVTGETLVTYSLGSCVGLTLYDPVARVGGMIHCMLPLSKIDPVKAKAHPYMFVDTGVTTLIKSVFDMGASKSNLIAKVTGAGSPLGQEKIFKIGQRNYTVLRKILWKNNILIKNELVGGTSAKTMFLEMSTGRTWIKIEGKEVEL